jgi:hypothetical protein
MSGTRLEVSCWLWDRLAGFCEVITGGRHFYGALQPDLDFGMESRICRLCRTTLIPCPPSNKDQREEGR